MKKYHLIPLLGFLLIANVLISQVDNLAPGMTNTRMGKLLEKEAQATEGVPGNWQVLYKDRLMLIITDESNNRMRIFSPIIAETEMESGEMKKMLEANFHSALDAKYSIYEGYAISVFTHPMKELTKEQFLDALGQVYTLAENYGTTYSSTLLIFGGGFDDEKDTENPKKEEKRINKKPGGKS